MLEIGDYRNTEEGQDSKDPAVVSDHTTKLFCVESGLMTK